MPTLNRNAAVLTLEIGQRQYRIGACLCLTSLLACVLFASLATAQQSRLNPNFGPDVGQGSPQTSILVSGDESESASDTRTASRENNVAQSSPGFLIPQSPTARSFTDPDSTKTKEVNDGSQAIGTFAFQQNGDHAGHDHAHDHGDHDQHAHGSAQPSNQGRFDPPQPPMISSQPLSGGSNSPATLRPRSFQTPDNANRLPSITQNGLRSATSQPYRSLGDSSSGSLSNRDSQAARPSRTLPPIAKMPEGRFNTQIYSSRDQNSNRVRSSPTSRAVSSVPSSVMVVDQHVAQTSYAQNDGQSQSRSTSSTNDSEGALLANRIIDRYSMNNTTDPLPGQPTSLRDMLQPPLPQQSRQPMVHQYWETWYDWATLLNATEYRNWLDGIPNGSGAGDNGLLQAARSQAANQVLAAEIQLTKTQSKLQQFMRTTANDLPPLPSDLPLIETYETHYDLYQSRRMLPASLRGINEMLPKTMTLITSRAKTVQMAQAAIKQTLEGYQSRQNPLASVLEAGRVWRSSEQDLLASVTSYNQAIADYSLNVTRRFTTPDQTVAMLIGNPKPFVQQSIASQLQGRQTPVGQNGFGQTATSRSSSSSQQNQVRPTNFSAAGSSGFSNGASRSSNNNRQADARPALGNFSSNNSNRSATSRSPSSPSFDQPSSGGSAQPQPQNAFGGSTTARPQSTSGGTGSGPTADNVFGRRQKSQPAQSGNRTANQFNGFGS